MTLGLTDPLIEKFGALDVEEVRPRIRTAGPIGHGPRQAVCNRLRDEGLAAPGWAVEEDPLRWHQPVARKQVAMEVWQFDRIANLFDL